MEKKVVQRIIGVIVIIALAVILFPVLFNTGPHHKTARVKAPAFPKPPSETAVVTPQPNQDKTTAAFSSPQPAASSSAASASSAPAFAPNTTSAENSPPSSTTNSAPAITNAITKTLNTANSSNTTSTTTTSLPTGILNTPEDPQPASTSSNTNKPATHTSETKSVTVTKTKVTDNTTAKSDEKTDHQTKPKTLSNTSKTASATKSHWHKINPKAQNWVVQVGVFKNKDNAKRLVNQLRQKGFTAFTRVVNSSISGQRTHVYVGPATQKPDARELASKVKSEVHMQGFVTSFQPLDI